MAARARTLVVVDEFEGPFPQLQDCHVGGRTHALKVGSDAQNHLFLPPDWSIMEVKVNDAVPDWVTSLLARHNCQLRRVSKYCAVLANEQQLDAVARALALPPVQNGGR